MKKISLMPLMFAVLISLTNFISADVGDSCGMWGMVSGSYGFGIGLFSWIFGLLVLVALVLLIIWLIKQIQKK